MTEKLTITTTPLGSYEVFTSEWMDVEQYTDSVVNILTDQSSDISGVVFQHSMDASNISYSAERTVYTPGINTYVTHKGKYFQLVYTNGSTAQSKFRIQVTHNNNPDEQLTSINTNIYNIALVQQDISDISLNITTVNNEITSLNDRLVLLENASADVSSTPQETYDDTEIRQLITNNSNTINDISSGINYYNYHLEIFSWGKAKFDNGTSLYNDTLTPSSARKKRIISGSGNHAWTYNLESNKGYWRMTDVSMEGVWRMRAKVTLSKHSNYINCVLMYINKGTTPEYDLVYGRPNPYNQSQGSNFHEAIIDGQSIVNYQLIAANYTGSDNQTFERIARISYNDPVSIYLIYQGDATSTVMLGFSGHIMFEYLGPDLNNFDTSETTY